MLRVRLNSQEVVVGFKSDWNIISNSNAKEILVWWWVEIQTILKFEDIITGNKPAAEGFVWTV
jgi:hypothetical protein